MKAEEIKEGLRVCCSNERESCKKCPYFRTDGCTTQLMFDALDLIQFAEKVIEGKVYETYTAIKLHEKK